MNRSLATIACVGGAVFSAVLAVAPARAERSAGTELAREATWSIPTPRDVRGRVEAWVASRDERPTEQSLERVAAVWRRADEAPSDFDPLDAAIDTFAIVGGQAEAPGIVAEEMRAATARRLVSEMGDSLSRDAARLWLGRQLTRRNRFDEALPLLAGLEVADAIDPAALLFHRAACQHWLLDADGAVESIDRLLERAGEIPVRYERVARLLRADAAALERGSLDHIARRMRDVTRRLDLGRAGPATRAVQDGVIESLDKLLEKLEKDRQQQGGGGAGGQGQGGGGKPMDDSRIAGGTGPGEVQKREIGTQDGWGNLPPHQRDEALQQIGREFPPHYREAIEQYFKRLASGGEDR